MIGRPAARDPDTATAEFPSIRRVLPRPFPGPRRHSTCNAGWVPMRGLFVRADFHSWPRHSLWAGKKPWRPVRRTRGICFLCLSLNTAKGNLTRSVICNRDEQDAVSSESGLPGF